MMSPSIHRKLAAQLCCLALASSPATLLQAASDSTQTASQAVLVELFTSEGCSSCPPADRLLSEFDRKQPVPGTTIVVLSEHVDYWNQLGWRDPYSSHQWSERQDDYGRQFGLDSVYTPQMVIDGNRQVSGSDGPAVLSAIEQSLKTPHVEIAITAMTRTPDNLQIEFTAGSADHTVLYAVVADDADRSSVARGENAGRTLDHVAVARSLVKVVDLEKAPLDKKIAVALPPDAANRHLRLILFARDRKSGHIVGVVAREV
jgi:hypothetical protein